MQTSDIERKANLEELIRSAERDAVPRNEVFTMSELNKQLARSDAEYASFEKVGRRGGRVQL